jgi:hypothetical protein
MKKFKSFSPKVDSKRRLVLTRIYTGVNGSNSFCYQINHITKQSRLDKRFKTLFSYGTDDFDSVLQFYHSGTGEEVRVFKKPFKSIFGVKDKMNPVAVWEMLEENS